MTDETVRKVLRREKREMECVLTNEERLKRAQQFSDLDGEIEVLEDRVEHLKSQVKEAATQVDVKHRDIRKIARALHTGIEMRDVVVSVEVERNGNVVEIRDDTHEVVNERALTAQEAQETLDFRDTDLMVVEEDDTALPEE